MGGSSLITPWQPELQLLWGSVHRPWPRTGSLSCSNSTQCCAAAGPLTCVAQLPLLPLQVLSLMAAPFLLDNPAVTSLFPKVRLAGGLAGGLVGGLPGVGRTVSTQSAAEST